MFSDYLWIVAMGGIGAFGFGWATGANDVANAFGTSVGAKTLTMAQATLIAAIFEFVGAMVLGRVVTTTIAGGIADISAFKDEPLIYAYGMMWTVIVGGLWQGIASYCEWNVSATHSIIGGIIGFAFAAKGPRGVLWISYDNTMFPPYRGIVPIVLSWFIAPILTASASAGIFALVRQFVLRHPDAERRSLLVFPALVLLTSYINIYFVLTKGAKKYILAHDPHWTDSKAAWITAVISVGLSLLALASLPYIKSHLHEKARRQRDKDQARADAALKRLNHDEEKVENGAKTPDSATPPDSSNHKMKMLELARSTSDMIKKAALHGVSVDIHDIVETDELVAAIHEHAEVFSEEAEQVFAYLQVFSAICVILAHGAGEVGYMAGPLGTIWDIYQTEKLHKKLQPPIWIVFYSAMSLVIGLATYGYNVTRAMGTRMCKLTPSRGFSAELSTALVILVSSQWGLPNSSSQCITGGIVGVGMLEGGHGVNWAFFGKTFGSWVATIVLMAGGTGLLFAQGVYSPCFRMKGLK